VASASSAAALPMVGDTGLEPVTCVAAAAQNMLNVIRLGEEGWAAVLTEMGYPYEVRTYPSRLAAVRAAASALRATGRPVGILAWAGVHSWVMTGFRATADPAAARMFTVTAASILDPWYPWVSTRWPRSEAPNVPRDMDDLMANVLPWKLASGPYTGRDGKFLLVVPLQP